MKKLRIFILALCCVMLCGCSDKLHSLYGKVVASGRTEEGKAYCILSISKEEEAAVIITEETYIYSGDQNADIESLKERDFADTEIWATGSKVRDAGITREGKNIAAYQAVSIDIAGYLSGDTVTLTDGAKINIWKHYDGVTYSAPDGTELLNAGYPVGPENSYVIGTKSLDDVDEAARMRVVEFYAERGLLYDETAELERAYSAFMKSADPANYKLRHIEQRISPSASDDEVMYFITTVMLPLHDTGPDGATIHEYRSGEAFDKATGQHINNFDLFNCSPDKALDCMIDISAGDIDPALRQEMHQAFKPECIIFFPECLEVSFSKGTLPSQEYGYGLALDYDWRLLEILQPWAAPYPIEN